MIKGAAALLAFDGHFDGWRVREIDVQPSVTIVVQEDHASAHGLNDIFLRRIGGVLESDSRFRGDVFKLRYRPAAALGGFCSRWRGRRLRVPTLGICEADKEKQNEQNLSGLTR